MSVADNMTIAALAQIARGIGIDQAAERRKIEEMVARLSIRVGNVADPVATLSGGNQQKVVIAREMRGREFSVLLAVQPTRGVDVGAIEFIHDQLRAARDRGKAVFLVSADLVEILALSDRVGVMYGGRLVVTLPRAEASPEILGPYMMGVRAGAAA
jgi:simple sugar transport system ATP-binding protein